ncbi:MAG: M23 family metallopeptidase [Pseudomonadota bacterium]
MLPSTKIKSTTLMIHLLILLLGFFSPLGLAYQSPCSEEIEREFHPDYLERASGELRSLRLSGHNERAPWPVDVKSIGHTMASYQRYSFFGSAYFHHGIDIRADAGSEVIASVGGQVINIENYMPGDDAYWEIAILDSDGFIWQYHHVERSSIPDSIFQAYQSKTPISAGTKLGEVYFWGITTFGERFHHIHLNVLGKNKTYLNPFDFLRLLPDDSAPEIIDFQVIKRPNGYTIAAEVKDLVLSNVFVLPPNELRVSIDGEKPFTVWKFDSLPGGSSNDAFVNNFYIPELACGDYECRKPVIDLGFRKIAGQVFPLSSGKHRLELSVSDYNGNEAVKAFEWTVAKTPQD